nr:hypothetical protein [uncultured Oscillibacter sp.]
MNILILNASPKRKGGASAVFSSLLRLFLPFCQLSALPLRNSGDYEAALESLLWADAVVVSSPLYMDAAPSHMLPFLEQAEAMCREKSAHFHLYVLSNSGFVEGHQNELHLRLYEAWCQKAGIIWGGGLGIGGGVMLNWMCILSPALALAGMAIEAVHVLTGAFSPNVFSACYGGALITLALCAGMLVSLGLLGCAIRRGTCRKNLYVRVLVPSFLFLPIADAFMVISSLCRGILPHKLLRKEEIK